MPGGGEEDLGYDNRSLGDNSCICFLSVEIRGSKARTEVKYNCFISISKFTRKF